MAQSYLLFDFGSDEDLAQQARRTIERWRQSFRLDKKLTLKFDREEPAEPETKEKSSKKAGAEDAAAPNERITMMVRLDFSDHERLSYQRWLARVPSEAPFKDAHPQVISEGDAEFAKMAERFEGGSGRAHGFSGSAT